MHIYHIYYHILFPSGIYSELIIGYYSSYSQALKAIDQLVKLPGFADEPSNFHVELIDMVNYAGDLYMLWYADDISNEFGFVFGYYTSQEEAIKARNSLLESPNYCCKTMHKLQVEKITLNEDDWIKGFEWGDDEIIKL